MLTSSIVRHVEKFQAVVGSDSDEMYQKAWCTCSGVVHRFGYSGWINTRIAVAFACWHFKVFLSLKTIQKIPVGKCDSYTRVYAPDESTLDLLRFWRPRHWTKGPHILEHIVTKLTLTPQKILTGVKDFLVIKNYVAPAGLAPHLAYSVISNLVIKNTFVSYSATW